MAAPTKGALALKDMLLGLMKPDAIVRMEHEGMLKGLVEASVAGFLLQLLDLLLKDPDITTRMLAATLLITSYKDNQGKTKWSEETKQSVLEGIATCNATSPPPYLKNRLDTLSQLLAPKVPKVNKKNKGKAKRNTAADDSEPATAPKGRRRRRGPRRFNRYIHQVLKTVHWDSGITVKSIQIVDTIMKDLIQRLSKEALNLAESTNRVTITPKDIESAVILVFQGELAKEANKEGRLVLEKKQQPKEKDPPKTQHARLGLIFPVSYIHLLLAHHCQLKVLSAASIWLTGVIEYVCREIMELAGNLSHEGRRVRIIPRDILLAIRGDYELDLLLPGLIPGAGVPAHIEPESYL